MKLWSMSLALLVSLAAPQTIAHAQQSDPQPAEDVLARLPQTLLGAPALRLPTDSSLVTYFGENIGSDPMAGVSAIQSTNTPTLEELRENARGAFHETGITRILRETTFTSPLYPGKEGFFGEYNTRMGLKQSWTIETGQHRIHVGVTLFDVDDRKRAEAAVAEEIFSGAQLSSAAQAGSK